MRKEEAVQFGSVQSPIEYFVALSLFHNIDGWDIGWVGMQTKEWVAQRLKARVQSIDIIVICSHPPPPALSICGRVVERDESDVLTR